MITDKTSNDEIQTKLSIELADAVHRELDPALFTELFSKISVDPEKLIKENLIMKLKIKYANKT